MYLLLSGSLPFVGNSENEILQSVLTTELTFEGKKWKKISEEAKDLIRLMLNRSVPDRISSSQLINHD